MPKRGHKDRLLDQAPAKSSVTPGGAVPGAQVRLTRLVSSRRCDRCTVHLNYRSREHVVNGRQEEWLAAKGFALNGSLRSSCSSGVPNGPYSGPVYSKAYPARPTGCMVMPTPCVRAKRWRKARREGGICLRLTPWH